MRMNLHGLFPRPVFVSDRVIVRPLRSGDAESLKRLFEAANYIPSSNLEATESWISDHEDDYKFAVAEHFVVLGKRGGDVCGFASLRFDCRRNVAHLAEILTHGSAPFPTAIAAVAILVGHAFSDLSLNRVLAYARSGSALLDRVFRTAGFTRNGSRYRILRREWESYAEGAGTSDYEFGR